MSRSEAEAGWWVLTDCYKRHAQNGGKRNLKLHTDAEARQREVKYNQR